MMMMMMIILFRDRGVGEQVLSPVMTFVLHVLLLGTKPGSPVYKSQARAFRATSPCQAHLETTLVTCGVPCLSSKPQWTSTFPALGMKVLPKIEPGCRDAGLVGSGRNPGIKGDPPRSRGALAPAVPGVAKGGFGVPCERTERE